MTLDPYIFEYFIVLFLAIFWKHLLCSLKNGQIWSKCAILRPKNSKKSKIVIEKSKRRKMAQTYLKLSTERRLFHTTRTPGPPGDPGGACTTFMKFWPFLGQNQGFLDKYRGNLAQICQKFPKMTPKKVRNRCFMILWHQQLCDPRAHCPK